MSALDEYLDFTEQTEPPTQFHRWAFISAVAACLGRRVWVPFGHGKIYPTQYCLLVGVPATRKSTSIDICRGVLERGHYNKFAYTKTSREKFLMDFEEGFDVAKTVDGKIDMKALLSQPLPVNPHDTVREVYINCSEFVDFIGRNGQAFIDTLTHMWDNPPEYPERLKNSKSVNIANPTVNMIGGITPSTLAEALPPSVVGQGFMSRILLVFSNPSNRKITWPPPPDEKKRQHLAEFFYRLGKLQGAAQFHSSAEQLLDEIYQNWPALADVRLQYYCGRRFTHLLKLCIVMAAVRESTQITRDMVIEANSILSWTEKDMHLALGEFGDSRHSKAAQKIMECVALDGSPKDFNQIWKAVSMDLDRRTQLQEMIQNLVSADKLELIHLDGRAFVKIRQRKQRMQQVGVDYPRFIREYGMDTRSNILKLIDDSEEQGNESD